MALERVAKAEERGAVISGLAEGVFSPLNRRSLRQYRVMLWGIAAVAKCGVMGNCLSVNQSIDQYLLRGHFEVHNSVVL